MWLADCDSQILEATRLYLMTAYKDFVDNQAGFPKFKSKHSQAFIKNLMGVWKPSGF